LRCRRRGKPTPKPELTATRHESRGVIHQAKPPSGWAACLDDDWNTLRIWPRLYDAPSSFSQAVFSAVFRGKDTVFDLYFMARALGGTVSGRNSIQCPGPGHSKNDRSLSVKLDPASKDGFVVYSHAGDDPIVCKNYVRERCGLPSWRPSERQPTTPIRRHDPMPDIERHAQHMRFARSIWDATKPAKGTIVGQYLVETRRLELPDTEAIRFHPRLRVTGTEDQATPTACPRSHGRGVGGTTGPRSRKKKRKNKTKSEK